MSESAPERVSATYAYVDTALGALSRRNHVVRVGDVDYKNVGAERYISHRRGPVALYEWWQSHFNANGNRTVEGYDGPVWDASLPFDFDDKLDPARALVWVRRFLDRMQAWDVPLDALRVYFSGAKGFHLEIPHTLFGGFEPSDKLHVYERHAALELMADIPFDTSVYDKLRLWRLTNTFNTKGQRYKVQLSIAEVRNLDMPDILELAMAPRPVLPRAPDEEWAPNEYLVEIWQRAQGIGIGPVPSPEQAWSEEEHSRVFLASIQGAIAASWPHSDPRVSRHTDYLMPLSGYLAQHMSAAAVSMVLKEAALAAGDRNFLDDRTRHWEDEIDRLAQSSADKAAAGQPVQGLPTISKRWPELADVLGAAFLAKAKHEDWAESPDDEEITHLSAVPDFPVHVLPDPMRALVRMAALSGLPVNLACGAALAAVAAAAGGEVDIQGPWMHRLIVWVALVAPRGAGKSPVQDLAFKAIREWDIAAYAQYRAELVAWKEAKDGGERPRDRRLRLNDTNFEALARRLNAGSGAGVWDLDELSKLLKGLGEYKRGGGADQARLLELWSASPWQFERVGSGRGGSNETDILIAKPTIVICGGLQTRLHARLGGEEDGLRPRWLPHLSNLPQINDAGDGDVVTPMRWDTMIQALLSYRAKHRVWSLSSDARRAFRTYGLDWKRQARAGENASVSAALEKADVQLLRIAGVFAEALSPGAGGIVDVGIIDAAAEYVDAVMDSWRALLEPDHLALSFKDERLDGGVEKLLAWLEEHNVEAITPRQLLRRHAAGVRSAADLDALMVRYEAAYPGSVVAGETTPKGGRPGRIVRAPVRRSPPVRRYGSVRGDNATNPQEATPEGFVDNVANVATPPYTHVNPEPEWVPVEIENGDSGPGKTPTGAATKPFVTTPAGVMPGVAPNPGDKGVSHQAANLCRACGGPLGVVEIRAGFGLHLNCTMPVGGSA